MIAYEWMFCGTLELLTVQQETFRKLPGARCSATLDLSTICGVADGFLTWEYGLEKGMSSNEY